MKRASVYLVLQPSHRYDGTVSGIEVDRILRSKPKLRQTEVAVQLHLDIDEHLFEQFLPEVTVQITGERQLVVPEIEVAEQPAEPEEVAAAEAAA